MKAVELLAIGVRIFGILLFFVTLRDSPNWIVFINHLPEDGDTPSKFSYFQYAVVASFFMASFLMIKFPLTLSRMLFSPSTSDSPLLEENGEAIQHAGITIVGVYVLTWSIPALFRNIILLWRVNSGGQIIQAMGAGVTTNLLVEIVQILLGFCCLFGARGIVNAVKALRR